MMLTEEIKQMYKEMLIAEAKRDKTMHEYLRYYDLFQPFGELNQATISLFFQKKSFANLPCRAFMKSFLRFIRLNYTRLGITEQDKTQISLIELPKSPKINIPEIIPLTSEEIQKLEDYFGTSDKIEEFRREKYKIMLRLSYHAGLRVGELMRLKISSFSWSKWEEDKVSMGEVLVEGKGGKEAYAYVLPEVMERIAKYIFWRKEHGMISEAYIFAVDNEGNPKNCDNGSDKWERILKQAGIDTGLTKLDAKGKPIKATITNPHRLRHSYATWLIRKGLDMSKVQKILRHNSITSTQRYIHLDDEEIKNELLNLNNKVTITDLLSSN